MNSRHEGPKKVPRRFQESPKKVPRKSDESIASIDQMIADLTDGAAKRSPDPQEHLAADREIIEE